MTKNFAAKGLTGFGPGRILFCLGWFAALGIAPRLLAQPIITVQPTSQFVSSGTTVIFNVSANGAPGGLVTFQWKRNGVNIPGENKTLPAGGASFPLQIDFVQPTNCGSYNVVVSDLSGAVESDIAVLVIKNIPALPATDAFSASGSLGPNFNGVGRTDNFGATDQSGEPHHGNEPGGASVWLRWTAPVSGVATFSTLGSGFDTTLGVYTGKNLSALLPQGENDDDADFLNSVVSFNAIANTEYNIAVDGFYGAQGNIVVNWSLNNNSPPVPTIVTQPQSITAPFGGTVVLSVLADTNFSYAYQWLQNGLPAGNAPNAPSFTQSNLTASAVGDYRVRISRVGTTASALSAVAHVQINSQDSTGSNPGAEAQDKFRAAVDPNNGPGGTTGRPNAAPAGGFTGTQIFTTVGGTKELGEPDPCGIPGGASSWYAYVPPASGSLMVDTTGTTFSNVLAAYTGPGTGFASLVPVACGNPGGGSSNQLSMFQVTGGTPYYLMVDSVTGAGGTVKLSYSLFAPPAITLQPLSQTVPAGSNVTLVVSAVGTPTMTYQWRTNANDWSGKTAPSATVNSFHAGKEGAYDVFIINSYGTVTSTPAMLYLAAPLRFTNYSETSTGSFTTLLLGAATTNYIVEATTNLGQAPWLPVLTNSSPVGIISLTDTNLAGYSNRLFRARAK